MEDEKIKVMIAFGLFILGGILFIVQTTLNGQPLSSLLFDFLKVL